MLAIEYSYFYVYPSTWIQEVQKLKNNHEVSLTFQVEYVRTEPCLQWCDYHWELKWENEVFLSENTEVHKHARNFWMLQIQPARCCSSCISWIWAHSLWAAQGWGVTAVGYSYSGLWLLRPAIPDMTGIRPAWHFKVGKQTFIGSVFSTWTAEGNRRLEILRWHGLSSWSSVLGTLRYFS